MRPRSILPIRGYEMSSKMAGLIIIVVVLLIVLSGGLSNVVDISVNAGNKDGIPDNGVSWGQNDRSTDYACTGAGKTIVCTER